jgi:hypothetical protein
MSKPNLTIYIDDKSEAWIESIRLWLKHQKGNEYVVTVNHIADKRSDAQNRFYWKLLRLIVDASKGWGDGGFDLWKAEDFHEAFSEKYLRGINEVTGRERTKSTTALSIEEFSAYLEKLINEILINLFNGCLTEKDSELYKAAQGIK